MLKKILLLCAVLVALAILLEVLAFVHEKRSYKSFATYWNNQNAKAKGTITYVALGDSTAQGVGTHNPQNGYPGLLAKRIASRTGQSVKLINLSVTGAKIQDLLDKQLPQLATYKPDIVTIEIGANDIGPYNSPGNSAEFAQRFTTLVNQLPAGTYISDIPYFGGIIRASAKVASANGHIHEILASPAGQKLNQVQLYQITRQRQSFRNFSADLFHPNDRGYINWADAFWQQIQTNLPPK